MRLPTRPTGSLPLPALPAGSPSLPARARRAARRVLAVGLLIGVGATAACSTLPLTPVSQPTASAAANPSRTDGSASLAEFRGDIDESRSSVEQYWSAVLTRRGDRFQPISQLIAYRGANDVRCAGSALGLNNAAYCADGDFIAYDARWAQRSFRQIGDAFIYYLIGHEYGHAMQRRLGITHRFTIQHELQADCFAGAYIGDSVRAKQLQLQTGDLRELRRGLAAVADDESQPWFAAGAHGTAAQRTSSFFNGYNRSLRACDL